MKIRKPESYILIIFCFIGLHVVHAQQIAKEELIYLTDTWKGERFDDGRPKIPADLIERAKGISIDVAWQILDNEGYASQYEGEWKNDQRNGLGTFTYSNGDKYQSEWKNDNMDGQGTYLSNE